MTTTERDAALIRYTDAIANRLALLKADLRLGNFAAAQTTRADLVDLTLLMNTLLRTPPVPAVSALDLHDEIQRLQAQYETLTQQQPPTTEPEPGNRDNTTP